MKYILFIYINKEKLLKENDRKDPQNFSELYSLFRKEIENLIASKNHNIKC